MEPNSFKCSSIRTVHSMELKLSLYTKSHRILSILMNLGTLDFLQEYKNEFLCNPDYGIKLHEVC